MTPEYKQSCGACRWSRLANRYSHRLNASSPVMECRHGFPEGGGWPEVQERDWCRGWEVFPDDDPPRVGIAP